MVEKLIFVLKELKKFSFLNLKKLIKRDFQEKTLNFQHFLSKKLFKNKSSWTQN